MSNIVSCMEGFRLGTSNGVLLTMDDASQWFHSYMGGAPVKLTYFLHFGGTIQTSATRKPRSPK